MVNSWAYMSLFIHVGRTLALSWFPVCMCEDLLRAFGENPGTPSINREFSLLSLKGKHVDYFFSKCVNFL